MTRNKLMEMLKGPKVEFTIDSVLSGERAYEPAGLKHLPERPFYLIRNVNQNYLQTRIGIILA